MSSDPLEDVDLLPSLHAGVEQLSKTRDVIRPHPSLNEPFLGGMNHRLRPGGHDSRHDLGKEPVVRVIDHNGAGGEDLIGLVLRDKKKPAMIKPIRWGLPISRSDDHVKNERSANVLKDPIILFDLLCPSLSSLM